MRVYYINTLGCCVFALFACSFGGCECFKSCSGCSHSCHSQDVCNEVESAVSVQSITKDVQMVREKSASGLEWEVLQEGSGDNPAAGKTVVVHYTGWLNEDGKPGKKFDSSVDRGQKFSFRIGIGMVIPGWDEGVMGMKVGEKRRLYIPSNLAYGVRGAGGVIPPNADLIFDVELFDIS